MSKTEVSDRQRLEGGGQRRAAGGGVNDAGRRTALCTGRWRPRWTAAPFRDVAAATAPGASPPATWTATLPYAGTVPGAAGAGGRARRCLSRCRRCFGLSSERTRCHWRHRTTCRSRVAARSSSGRPQARRAARIARTHASHGKWIYLIMSTIISEVEVGKLASLLAVTITPQKDINVRPPVGGPFFFVFWGGLALCLVLPLFVSVGSVSIVSCASCPPSPSTP